MSIPIALQLFAVRGEVNANLAATLEQVKACGYAGAEPWGYDGKAVAIHGHSGADVRRMYDDNGLVCCGMHMNTDALLGDNLARTIELNQILGNRILVIAGDKPHMSSIEGIKELASILNATSEKLAAEGMYVGYHAHGFDFEAIEGESAWDRLFAQTNPEVVMQVDIGNTMKGGGDPLDSLRRFPGRARSVHLKEFGEPENGAIGEGTVDWNEVFRLVETLHPTEWYVVEQGSKDGTGFDIPRRSLEALRGMGK